MTKGQKVHAITTDRWPNDTAFVRGEVAEDLGDYYYRIVVTDNRGQPQYVVGKAYDFPKWQLIRVQDDDHRTD